MAVVSQERRAPYAIVIPKKGDFHDPQKFTSIGKTLVLVSIAAIGLLATSAMSALAGSGGFNTTGSKHRHSVDRIKLPVKSQSKWLTRLSRNL
jgi:hypothetical protein